MSLIDTNGWKRPRWQRAGIFSSILWMSAGLRRHPATQSCYLLRSGAAGEGRNADADPSLRPAARKQGRPTRPLSRPHGGKLLPRLLVGIYYKRKKDARVRPEGRPVLLGEGTFASPLRSVVKWPLAEVRGRPPDLQLAQITGLMLQRSRVR